jgi:hypothetical protein
MNYAGNGVTESASARAAWDDQCEYERKWTERDERTARERAESLVADLVSALQNLSGWKDLADDLPADKRALYEADLQAARQEIARASA